ncbi:MAG: alpha/beta hydrolase [Myxococcales bacterium]|nr:alpha/beta hydrolase [Myxococcales bacterium]
MPRIPLRDGQSMHVHTIGRGPTVVLVHGFAMHGAMWLPSVLPLAAKYRFVLPALRGFGRSRHVPHGRADVVETFADDLEDLLAALGEPKVYLGGLSMGALTSVAFASRGGFERVVGYAHVDQAARIHNGEGYDAGLFGAGQGARFEALRDLRAKVEPHRHRPFDALPRELREAVSETFARFFRDAFHLPWLRRATGAIRSPSVAKLVIPTDPWAPYFDCLAAYLDVRHDFEESLREAHTKHPVPLTFMIGARSTMYPPHGQRALAESILRVSPRPDQVRIVELDAGHAIPVEAPVAFVRALDRAISEAFSGS